MIPAGQPERRSELRIGRYAVVGRIGRGGMGMVYRGFDETLEREIAIKTLTIEGSGDAESRARFGIEARAAAKLQHPNIITVYELGEDRGVSFIAMELLPGIDLESLLRSEEALLLQEKLEIVIQVCRGLAFAHEKGVVHRDIKPANIRLLDDGTIKIMDFGIAKLDTTGVTRDGMMIGTLSYMSPEQIQGKKLDGRSDVFSVGVLLYQLLAGERPFPGPGSEVLYQICHQPTPELQADLGSAGPRLAALVSRALAKDPADRIQSASRFADELAQVLDWYSRSAIPPVGEEDLQLLADARRRIRDDPPEDSVELYAGVVERNPHSVDARRALRAANRRLWEQDQPPHAEDVYPELEATFRAGATPRPSGERKTLDTFVQPPTLQRETTSSRGLLVGLGILLVSVALGAAWMMRGGEAPPGGRPSAPTPLVEPVGGSEGPVGGEAPVAPGDGGVAGDDEPAGARDVAGDKVVAEKVVADKVVAGGETPGPREEPAPVASEDPKPTPPPRQTPVPPVTVSVTTEPPGAAVSVDGRAVEGVTPLELSLDRATAHRLELSLQGYQSRTLRLEAGEATPRLAVPLEAVRPPGTLAVSADYPVDVFLGERVLAQGERSPQVSLAAGSHTVTLRSKEYFLDYRATVEVAAGERSTLRAPGLGRIHIRATPGNCRIFIDGDFADYPPISDKPIAAGPHRVSFRWPDGSTKEKGVEVKAGESAYVTERQ